MKRGLLTKIVAVMVVVVITLSDINLNGFMSILVSNNEGTLVDVNAKEKGNKEKDPTIVKELKDLRTADSSTYLLSNGSKRLEIYSQNIRFEKNGKYVDYNPTLKEVTNQKKAKKYEYTNTAGDSKVYFPKNLDDTEILMEKDDYAISFKPIGEVQEGNSVLENNITYTQNEGIEYKYTSHPSGIKEDIILNEKPNSNVFSFFFRVEDMKLKTIEGLRDIRIVDEETDEMVGFIAEPNIKDADGELRYAEVWYEVEDNEDGSYVVNIVVDEEYFEAESTEYPVTIDPIVYWADSMLESANITDMPYTLNSNYKNTSSIRVQNKGNEIGAYANTVEYCCIDTSAMTSGSALVGYSDMLEDVYIEKAHLDLTEYETNTITTTSRNPSGDIISTIVETYTPGTVEVRAIESTWDPDTVTYNTRPTISSNVLDDINCTGIHLTKHEADVTGWAREVINGDRANYGLALVAKEEGTGNTFYSGQYNYVSTEDNPKFFTYMRLTIDYREPMRYYGIQGVYTPTGNYSDTTVDFTTKTVLGEIPLGHIYNSLEYDTSSIMGNGFTYYYAMKVEEKHSGIYITMPNSARWKFWKNLNNYEPSNNTGSLTKVTNSSNNEVFLLTLLDGTKYYFDNNNYLDYIEDKYGNRLNFQMDGNGKIIYITDCTGTHIAFNYSNGLLSKIDTVKNNINTTEVEYTYSNEGNLTTVTYKDGSKKHYDYTNGKVSKIWYSYELSDDENTSNEEETTTNEESINELKYVDITYYTDGAYEGMVESVIDTTDVKTTYSYDFDALKTTINTYVKINGEYKLSRSTEQLYNDNLAITSIKDVTGNTEQQLNSIEYETTTEEHEEIDPDRPLSQIDEYGNETKYTYDDNGNVIKIVYEDESYEEFEYNSNNNLVESTDRNGLVTEYIYKASDGLLYDVLVDGICVASYRYYNENNSDDEDIYGLVQTETDANNNVTTYEYDNKGNVTKTIQTIDGVNYSTINEYDDQDRLSKTTDPNGIITEYEYDLMDNVLLTKVYKNGNENVRYTRTVHDGFGRVIQEINTLEYQSGLDDLVADNYGNPMVGFRTEYNYKGQVIKEIDNQGNITEYTYNSEGLLEKEISPNSSYTRYEYDNKGREIAEYFGESQDIDESEEILLKETAYGVGENIVTETEYITEDGTITSTTEEYNWEGNLVEVIRPNGLVETYDYTNGLLTEESNNEGVWTRYTYDTWGRVLTETSSFDNNGNAKKKYTYDDYGNVIKEEVKNNAPGKQVTYSKTEYSYDSRNNLTKTIVYKGEDILSVNQSYYSWDNQLLREYKGLTSPLTINGLDNVTNANNQDYSVIKYEYNDYGELIKKTDALNKDETYTYDELGRKTGQVDRNGTNHIIEYDKNGNVIKETSGSIVKEYTYDSMGNKLTEKEGNTEITYVYDKFDNCTSETVESINEDTTDEIATKTYTYDLTGNMLTQIVTVDEQVKQNVSYTYDLDGNMTKVEEAGDTVAEYTYNKLGQLIKTENANGTTEENTYNYAGLVTSTINKSETGVISYYDYTYYYNGQQKSKTDSSSKTTYVYDEAGQLVTEERVETEAVDNTIYTNAVPIQIDTLVYVNATEKSKIKYFSFVPATTDTYTIECQGYSSSPLGYLFTSTGSFINANKNSAENGGFKLTRELTAGTKYLIGVCDTEGAGWCTFNVTQNLSDGNLSFATAKMIEEDNLVIAQSESHYDMKYYSFIPTKDGNYTIESCDNEGVPVISLYDESGNLLISGSNNIGNYDVRIEYNLTAGTIYKIATKDMAGAGPHNILITSPVSEDATITEYTYDANGNRTKLTETEGDTITETVYIYDKNNRLLSKKKGSDNAFTYLYDDNGNNIRKSDGTVQTFDVLNRMISYKAPNGTTTTYTYYPDDMRKSKKTGTEDELTQIWIGDEITLDMKGNNVKSYIHGKKLIKEGSNWYVYNAHGDVTALTNSSGTITKNYDYDAFGVLLTEDVGTDTNPYRYSGEYYDIESGYTYLRARYYDASIGRFINEDPALDGINWYIYCANDPIGMVDPSGLWSKSTHEKITKNLYIKYFRRLGVSYMFSRAILEGSVYPDEHRVDGNEYDSDAWHGKKGYSGIKESQIKKAETLWKRKNYASALRELGKGLHTIQDRYAHTVLKANNERKYANKVGAGTHTVKELLTTKSDDLKYIDVTYDYNLLFILNQVVTLKTNVHKVTADNENADFDGNKWVYTKGKSKRYKKAVRKSEQYMVEFIDLIK